ncbi:MAG: hypothetical protein HY033_13510 [Ignavibacteriae bacterium]|nr:hypothetical protein [Ignavibacteria bacterium]MBI3365909.1 hypothetical protein [Ignavibacteriota bacterium]
MAKKTTAKHEILTHDLLVRELVVLEQRLDAKIDSATQSFKEYVDSRWTQLDTKFTPRLDTMDSRFDTMDSRFDKMDSRFEKMDRHFEELVGMFVQQGKKIDASFATLNNHEQRITTLEARS